MFRQWVTTFASGENKVGDDAIVGVMKFSGFKDMFGVGVNVAEEAGTCVSDMAVDEGVV
jgi:hypothetical protein